MVYFFFSEHTYHIVEDQPYPITWIRDDFAHEEARVAFQHLFYLWLNKRCIYCVVWESFEDLGTAVHNENDCVVPGHLANDLGVPEVVENFVDLNESWCLLMATLSRVVVLSF